MFTLTKDVTADMGARLARSTSNCGMVAGLTALLLALFFLLFATPRAYGKDLPVVTLSELTARFGKPDQMDSTEYDKPRPPMVSKWLIYKKEHIKVFLSANAQLGAPPPYASWILIGYIDTTNNTVLSNTEGERRLSARKKK